MPKTGSHINNFRRVVLMCFVLFSLSPCTVKKALFTSANADYAKPLNKSRTITPTNSCSYSQNESQQISIVKKSKVNKQIEPVGVFDNQHFAVYSVIICNNYSNTTSGNSPPKYILFKRLKIDIV